jgi:hypothetical protein
MPLLKSFTYTKDSGEKSTRTVYPIGVVDDKLFSIDMSDLTDKERLNYLDALDEVHKKYIQGIKDIVGSARFRYFFFRGIS